MASSAGGPDTPIDRRIKVLSIGDGGVGKSCLIKRYCEGKVLNNSSNRSSSSPAIMWWFVWSGGYLSGDGALVVCVVLCLCEQFVTRYISTIGVDFGVKPVTINNVPIKVNFWDLSGHQEFFEIRNEFYKDTQGVSCFVHHTTPQQRQPQNTIVPDQAHCWFQCMIVYDVTNRASFEAVDKWLLEAKKFDMGDAICVLCANKVQCSGIYDTL